MNELTIAVAGARKTQGIVDSCASPNGRRILVLALTQANQHELATRIKSANPLAENVEILGWYSFLLRHFIRPYLPLLFAGRRLNGFNYEGEPGRYASGEDRYFDNEGRAYQRYLASLACKVHEASQGSVVDRLEHIYTDIYIDEAQDIGGWSLEVLDILFASKLDVHLVGDMRQALISTDPRDRKHRQFKAEKVIDWYRIRERKNVLAIKEQNYTYRSNQVIADLSDRVFDPSHGYSATISYCTETNAHSGLFRVHPSDVAEYFSLFQPLCVHWRSDLGRQHDLPYITFGKSKGLTTEHVLILPTAKFKAFLKDGTYLDGRTACSFYVGVTRAIHSAAFILDKNDVAPGLQQWLPG
ncbi:ATP-dependent helicase [Nocardia cyriacigeorgica]|uniref:ATP-dependent helicase n=1 Tax=Nocardia cyriacigeorgica TaxID=135487 RepID=UPI00189609DE|nr:ATP-dependent helicase [Nocardia cyriacigeorgica]MBF6097828.1 ATP-dependent helicase [Nocardia cyriacigeorgica]